MSDEPSYLAFARANVRDKISTTWPCVRGLVDRIDRDAKTITKLTPRTITTVEELQKMPWGSAVLANGVCVLVNDGDPDGDSWASLAESLEGGPVWLDATEVQLPVKVLHEPAR